MQLWRGQQMQWPQFFLTSSTHFPSSLTRNLLCVAECPSHYNVCSKACQDYISKNGLFKNSQLSRKQFEWPAVPIFVVVRVMMLVRSEKRYIFLQNQRLLCSKLLYMVFFWINIVVKGVQVLVDTFIARQFVKNKIKNVNPTYAGTDY